MSCVSNCVSGSVVVAMLVGWSLLSVVVGVFFWVLSPTVSSIDLSFVFSVWIELSSTRCSQESGISDKSQSSVGLLELGLATCFCLGVSSVVPVVASVAVVLFPSVGVVPPSCPSPVVFVGCAVSFDGGVFLETTGAGGMMTLSTGTCLLLVDGSCEPVNLPSLCLYRTGGGVHSRDESDESGCYERRPSVPIHSWRSRNCDRSLPYMLRPLPSGPVPQ